MISMMLASRRLAARARGGPRMLSAHALTVDNPYSGETYCEVALTSEADARATISRAAAAQKAWERTALSERIALCERFMAAMEAMRGEVAADISGMMGKPYEHAWGEMGGLFERTRGMMALAPAALAEEALPARGGCERAITREPVGVVLAICPWNFPLLTAVNTVVPAVLAGNAVVIKHAERTPLCGEHFARAFAAAGAPEGLVAAVQTPHDATARLIASEKDVGFVAFTGSVAGGRAVYSAVASARFIDCTLELGGKDPAYVAEDADAAAAAAGLVDGACFNAGQSCCGIERVYVHRSKYDAFLEAARAECGAYVLGDPADAATTQGPMAQPGAAPFLGAQVRDALAKGARLLSGAADDAQRDAAGKGRFFAPALLADCTHGMDVMRDESFGPIVAVAPVDGDDEAVALMRDSEYGLTAAVFTQDAARVRDIGRRVGAGTVFMNRCDYLDPELPWTAGGEHTGKGVSLSKHGFGGVTKLKGYNMRV